MHLLRNRRTPPIPRNPSHGTTGLGTYARPPHSESGPFSEGCNVRVGISAFLISRGSAVYWYSFSNPHTRCVHVASALQ